MGLKDPLYALLIAPDEGMRRAIITGDKAITIREGHRDYRAGRPVMLCCQLVPWAVMADIAAVRHTTVENVTREELAADGFADWEDMLAGLRRFYPSLTMASPVTVIRWENVRGWLVDNADNLVFHE
jgi:hypothetical protein